MAEKYTLTLDMADAEVTVEIEPCDISIRGNVMVSEDADLDAEAEQWVIDQLDSGNEYAWCDIRVTAKLGGFVGIDTLGACSAETREQLEELIEDYGMRDNALADLRQTLIAAGAIKK